MYFLPSYSEKTDSFGYHLHPEMLLENSEGILQIYVEQNDLMIPKIIKDFQATSSDTSVIKILSIQNNPDGYSLDIKLQAIKEGNANIAIAATGLSSEEIPITVHTSNNHAAQILMKITPDDFPVDGPRFGYISVELATTGGLPTKAEKDTTIKINSPNESIINLENNEMVIHKGEYYALEKFQISSSGDAMIYAESDGLKKTSEKIHVRKAAEPLQLQLYTFPKNFNSFSTPKGYAIIELQDSEGKPVIADKDISISILVENPDVKINTSNDFQEVNFENKNLVIKKGEYLTYTKFSPRPDLGRSSNDVSKTYNISISAEDYNVKGDYIMVTHQEIGLLEGKGPAKIDVVPFLTTGKNELIGVIYFETEITASKRVVDSEIPGDDVFESSSVTVPVMANDNYKMDVHSSHLGTVKTIPAEFKRGDNAALIFGKTGTFMSEDGAPEIYVTDNDGVKTVIGAPEGPIEDDLSLVTESLIPKILAGTDFPVIAYLNEAENSEGTTSTDTTGDTEKENGRIGVTPFIKDTVLTFSTDDLFEIDSTPIKQNQPYVTITGHSYKTGTSDINSHASNLEGVFSDSSYTTDPTTIHLSYAKNVLSGTKTLATLQLLDSADNPVYVKKEYEIKLVSNNKDIISIPDVIRIEEGNYYTNFVIDAKNSGNVEIAALSEDLPLAKFNIESIKVEPIITLSVPESILPNEKIEAELKIDFKDMTLPLDGYSVNWKVTGAEIKQSDIQTNVDGVALLSAIASDTDDVTIQAIITGDLFSESNIEKNIKITQLENSENTGPSNEFNLFSGTNLMFIAIPGAAGGAMFYLKRTNRMEGILERINIMDRFNEIKERVIELRTR